MKTFDLDRKQTTSWPINKLYQALDSGEQGLTTNEAIRRSRLLGYNQLKTTPKKNLAVRVLAHFHDPMVIILLVAAAISSLTNEWENALIIFAIVFLSIALDFYQENKSNRAAEKISKRLAIQARVKRNGQEQEINTKYLVPGDIIILSAGDIIPADGRIIDSTDFFLNESGLTGESLPVEKDPQQDNLAFSGTSVISGSAKMIITKIGQDTEFGQIAGKVEKAETENDFERGIKKFGYLVARLIAIIVVIIFLINSLNHKNLIDSLLFALAIAVGITPELLPMIMSVNMAKGAGKMAKKGVLVKRLDSIPTFGSMDILCTDKTGTLTRDHITVIKHIDLAGHESAEVLKSACLNGYFETGIQSVLDKAILEYQKDKKISLKGCKKIKEFPYDFNRKRSSIIYSENKSLAMATKGAPEEIFKITESYLSNGKIKKFNRPALEQAMKLYEDLSRQGLRVLAIAEKKLIKTEKTFNLKTETDLTLLGFMAFYDPPKNDVRKTLSFMEEYGVKIKILTGDSPLVTKKICDDIGLEITGIITGEDLDLNKLSDENIFKKIKNATICARLSPSQKEKIIIELKKHGLAVGYLGDGINDAPSLKVADVGISVDNAVDVAKETADIILLKKGLQELMDGVIEGRKTFGNTMKYLLMGIGSNFGNMLSMIGASIYLPFFPMTASQILLNNFIYDNSQLALPSDNVDIEYLKKPKHWDISYIKKFMLVFGPISSLFDFLTFYLLFGVFGLTGGAFQAGWFFESIASQILVIFIVRTRKTPFLESRPSRWLTIGTLSAVMLSLLLVVSPFGHFFGFQTLDWPYVGVILCLVLIYLLLVEFVKKIFYKKLTASNNQTVI